jgi:class 3 adenylate cyclase
MGAAGQTTVIGDMVNMAYRLHTEAKSGQILISPAIYDLVEGAVVVEQAGPLTARGQVAMEHTYLLAGLTQGG